LVACGSDDIDGAARVASTDAEETVASIESAVVLGSWSDSTVTIFVSLHVCSWVGPAQANVATCAVSPSQVLVGGGAEIEGNGSPGALLTGSYPDQGGGLTTWVAESKSHSVSYPHRLRAYALGLTLEGLTASQLRANMFQGFVTSTTASHPSTSAGVASSRILVGGGARALFGGAGQLLTRSYPDFSGASLRWFAGSKDHGTGDPGTVRAYAIGINRCPAGYVGGCLKSSVAFECLFNHGGGYQSALRSGVGPQHAMVSIGGEAYWNGNGRMLADLIPAVSATAPNIYGLVRTKDHGVADGGATCADVLAIAPD
jgi:hypothetical protein